MPTTNAHRLVPLAALTLLSALRGQSDGGAAEAARPIDRRFAFAEETLHGAPAGRFEFEQWVTLLDRTDADPDFTRLDFKHELEYGLSQDVHLAVDFVEWHYEDSSAREASRYDATGVELKVRLCDPRGDTVGLGVKTEVEVGSRDVEWINTLIVDKVVERWLFAYNLELRAGWEGEKALEFGEADGEVVQSFGASLELRPTVYAGAEMVWGIPFPEWKSAGDQDLFLGPNFAFHGRDWAVTTTPLFRLAGGDDAPEFQLRLLFEVDF